MEINVERQMFILIFGAEDNFKLMQLYCNAYETCFLDFGIGPYLILRIKYFSASLNHIHVFHNLIKGQYKVGSICMKDE